MLLLKWACCEREANFTGRMHIKKFKGLMVTIDGNDLGRQPLKYKAFSRVGKAAQADFQALRTGHMELFTR
ncbi:hypothetical protein [Pseudomonas bohemica]|uniref:hypothetical protein n=1 Tax=Pseudomonas bohemica TaxID=2044872 RepID=UPI000DA62E94|nr:hypothetical protein [Pseudomonas bohemica]